MTAPRAINSTDRHLAERSAAQLRKPKRSLKTAQLEISYGNSDHTSIPLPNAVVPLLQRILEEFASGHDVTVMSTKAELTTQQAADLLSVSRPHLVKLLETGALPFHKVGTHRRVVLEDALEYQRREDAARLEVLAELTREAQELGLGY
jgi:excisionase family DNA binding protein